MTLGVSAASGKSGNEGGGSGLLPRSVPDLTMNELSPSGGGGGGHRDPSPSSGGSVSPRRSLRSSSNNNNNARPSTITDGLLLSSSGGGTGGGGGGGHYHRSTRRSPVMLRATNNNYPHHCRSQSVRTAKRPNRLELPEFRSRVSSMPLESSRYNPRLIDDEEIYRLRSFSITAKGVVNRGDSLRSRRSRSNTSVASSEAAPISAANSCASSHSDCNVRYRVALLGGANVGKTAITTQFMTSEYMNTYDASLDDDFGEKSVSVLLDGEESEMVFIDHPSSEMSVENFMSTYEPHAFVVVYSITDRSSYQKAEDILSYLWKGDCMRSKAVILVGNKTDLVRSRMVSIEEGKSLATSHDCKFIETSSGINHHVDELLVGILSQIRLKSKRSTDDQLQRPDVCSSKVQEQKKKYKGSRTVSFRAKGILSKLCNKEAKSKSCENLHVL